MRKLNIAVSKKGDWEVVQLKGPILEGSEAILTPLKKKLSNKVEFDFENVTITNTCGVSEWMEFINNFTKNRSVNFINCPPNIVMTMNIIPAFRSDAKVKSLFASYFCANCSHERWELFQFGDKLPTAEDIGFLVDQKGDVVCEKCSNLMSPEVPEREFFTFLLEDAS